MPLVQAVASAASKLDPAEPVFNSCTETGFLKSVEHFGRESVLARMVGDICCITHGQF